MKVIFMALLASINLYCNHDEIKGVYCPNYDEIEFSYAEELSILDKVDICLNWQKIIFNYLINTREIVSVKFPVSILQKYVPEAKADPSHSTS